MSRFKSCALLAVNVVGRMKTLRVQCVPIRLKHDLALAMLLQTYTPNPSSAPPFFFFPLPPSAQPIVVNYDHLICLKARSSRPAHLQSLIASVSAAYIYLYSCLSSTFTYDISVVKKQTKKCTYISPFSSRDHSRSFCNASNFHSLSLTRIN